MESKDMVSIIIPAHNEEKHLERCLDSILSQTYPHLEVLVVDDASTDGTWEICNAYAARDSRVKCFRNPSAEGVSSARNQGLNQATGQWIAFCDADDWIERDCIARLMEAAQENNADYVLSGYVGDIFRDGQLYMSRKAGVSEIRKGDSRTLATDFGYVFRTEHVLLQSCWAKLFRKSLIEENSLRFNTNVVCYEDFEFNLKYLCMAHRYAFLPYDGYHYTSQYGGNAIQKRRKDDLVDDIHCAYVALQELFAVTKDAAFQEEMTQWLFEAYRIPILKMRWIKETRKKVEIAKHLVQDEGFQAVMTRSKTFLFFYRLCSFGMYYLAVLFITKRVR